MKQKSHIFYKLIDNHFEFIKSWQVDGVGWLVGWLVGWFVGRLVGW